MTVEQKEDENSVGMEYTHVCDCSDMISDSTDSRTYEHCDKLELE